MISTQKRPSPKHIKLKLSRDNNREKILQAVSCWGDGEESNLQRKTYQISHQKLYRTGEWNDTFKILKDGNQQRRILYIAKLPIRYEGEIKAFKGKLREFATTRPAVQGMLRGALLLEMKRLKYTKR